MTPFSFLHLKNVPILEQLQIEEALLRADGRNWCLINTGSSKAIVMGISGKMENFIDLEKLNLNPIPVIKRFSGGGTVVIDENTVFITWIVNTKDTGVFCNPKAIHEFIIPFYKQAFHPLPIDLKENDYVVGEKKIGGNAQYLTKGRFLHHTSLLWDYDPDLMKYLLIPLKTPSYRKRRDHCDFITSLKNHIEKDEISLNLKKMLQNHFLIEEVDLKSIDSLLQQPHRKSTEWLK